MDNGDYKSDDDLNKRQKNNLPVLPMGLNIIEILPELVSDSLLSLSGRATAHNSEKKQVIIQMGY